MAWLEYSKITGRLNLYNGPPPESGPFIGPPIGSWPAHNDTASNSDGAWPEGSYDYSHYNSHVEMGFAPGCFNTSYGCDGVHVFSVPGRSGMGVHAGRTFGQTGKVGGKTLGCIRVPVDAMKAINDWHRHDPLVTIQVD